MKRCCQTNRIAAVVDNNRLCESRIMLQRHLFNRQIRRRFQSQRFTEVQHPQRSYKSVTGILLRGTRWGIATAATAFLGYDALFNEFTYCGAATRFGRSVKTAGLIAVDYLQLQSKDTDTEYDNKLKLLHQKSADRLLETCLLNGGLYIKVGQGCAAINHILPEEYTSTLSKLQDKCLPTSAEEVKNLFIKDFGKSPEEMYEEFDYQPVAAASLAQVFKAKLPSGETVAVKVQYNDLRKRFVSDVGTMIFLQDIIELIFKDYNFGWILRDLRKNLIYELDFEHEGKNAERCARDMKKFDYVYVPKIHWNYTKTRVLTMEWIDGIKINNMEAIKEQNLTVRDIDVKLFQLFSEQIFKTGFVHADPHPGNIFVRKSERDGKANIILLDHGLYEELPAEIITPLSEFWEATVLRDDHKMQVAANKLGIADYMKFAEVLFQQPIRKSGGHIRGRLTQQDIEYMQLVARQNFDAIMSTLKEMPRSMLFVVRNLNTVRAISHHHGDVVDRPRIMARYAQRCLYDRNRTHAGHSCKWMWRRIYFEYCLWSASFKLRLYNWYFNALYLVGLAPPEARTIMRDMMTPTLT